MRVWRGSEVIREGRAQGEIDGGVSLSLVGVCTGSYTSASALLVRVLDSAEIGAGHTGGDDYALRSTYAYTGRAGGMAGPEANTGTSTSTSTSAKCE